MNYEEFYLILTNYNVSFSVERIHFEKKKYQESLTDMPNIIQEIISY